jgi:hypothetical protein|nr:MAG TPA: putative tail component [Caudoviricetes sp.]
MTLEERIAQLQDVEARFPGELTAIAKGATIRAVEKAAELTPPTLDDLSGTNTRSGEMKQHWASDSKVTPVKRGDTYVTELNNDKQYASYVNDGHRMDRHFVPGLVINPESGMLEYNPNGKGGIVVGTKTQYVEGLFMEEAAHEEYHRIIRTEAARLRRALE